MSVKTIKSILTRNRNDIAFIFGNGINYYHNENNVSWHGLLLDLWDKYSFNTQSIIPKGITFTEFYDILEIQNYRKKNLGSQLQKDVAELMNAWEPSPSQNIILNRIVELDAPLLTTNFDDLIPKSLELKFYKLQKENFTDYYPWSCYFSNKVLSDPIEGFGVWYINGMISYQRSVKLGLTEYMGNVERARRLIHLDSELFSFKGKNQHLWSGYKTWLHVFFNKSLLISGLGLDENEVFIRWLLIERAKYFRRFPDRKHKGWFLTSKESRNKQDEGKKLFLKSLGFEIIELKSYKELYENIWK